MNPEQIMVAAFNATMGQTVRLGERPQLPTAADGLLFLGARNDRGWAGGLLAEELEEIRTALEAGELPDLVDGIVDLIYVALGLANAVGVALAPVFAAVHAANMKKVTGLKRADGKALKPEGWEPPDIAAVLRTQGWRGDQ